MSIANRLVLVLGAGASKEYGFPLGADLLTNISNSLNYRFDFGMRKQGDGVIFEALKKRYPEHLQRYVDAAIELARVVHHYPSIDEAIHLFSGKDEVIEVGKLAIARQIVSAEKKVISSE